MKAVGLDEPLFVRRGEGAYVTTADGGRYVDWVMSFGPLIFGHADRETVEAVQQTADEGTTFGATTEREVELAAEIVDAFPSIEQVRMVSSGTEAAMSAIRLARGATRRDRILKFAGCYHGHADAFLICAGSGAATFGVPDSPGVTAGAARDTRIARYNDLGDVDRAFQESPDGVAAVIVEPVAGNMGCVPPAPGFLAGLRDRCDRHGALLVFDEVITGFRLGPQGAAGRFGVTPDLVMLGKALGGGMPIAAFGGSADLMGQVSPAGPVYQAGTYAAHPLSIAAALAVLEALDGDPGLWARLEAAGARLAAGLEVAARAAGVAAQIQRVGSMWTLFFSPRPVHSWDDAEVVDRDRYAAFFRRLLARGILLPPSAFETAFVSAAHGEAEIAQTLEAACAAIAEAAS